MSDKDRIDQIMNRLETTQRILPNEDFISKMESVALAFVSPSKNVSRSTIMSIAASLLLLVMANIYTINKVSISSSETNTETLYEDYSFVPSNTIYQ